MLTANRIAAIAAFLTGLSGAILGVTNTFPHAWQPAAVAIAGTIGAVATAMHFMFGSQKSDALQANLQLKQIELEMTRIETDHWNSPGSPSEELDETSSEPDLLPSELDKPTFTTISPGETVTGTDIGEPLDKNYTPTHAGAPEGMAQGKLTEVTRRIIDNPQA